MTLRLRSSSSRVKFNNLCAVLKYVAIMNESGEGDFVCLHLDDFCEKIEVEEMRKKIKGAQASHH